LAVVKLSTKIADEPKSMTKFALEIFPNSLTLNEFDTRVRGAKTLTRLSVGRKGDVKPGGEW
jgi:hypothetical protein